MSILQFFKVRGEEEKTCFGQVSSLKGKESTVVNEIVEKALNETGKRGKYNKYSPEDRAKIGMLPKMEHLKLLGIILRSWGLPSMNLQ